MPPKYAVDLMRHPVAKTASAPAGASVGVASGSVLAENADRKGLTVVNLSSNRVSIAFGNPAVLDQGITLTPNGAFEMDPYTFTTQEVFAIASGAGSPVAIQEWT